MPIIVYGVSHKTAPLHIREHLSFSQEEIPYVLSNLQRTFTNIKEAMILSTCQRTEWYLYTEDASADLSGLVDRKTYTSEIEVHSYTLYEIEAIAHMMKVANGLDSSVLGEPQILGQMKTAYSVAKNHGFLGKHLEQVMQHIFAAAKKVRSETLIGQGAISLPYAAVSLGKCIFSEISNPYVVLIGAGAVIQSILNHLAKKKNITVVLANRSIEKGRKLAERYKAKAITLEELTTHIALADIVISATRCPSLILKHEQVEQALSARPDRLIFMMDMAVPRDIAPEVARLKNVFLYNIDDLHKIIQRHLDARAQAAVRAEQIIKEKLYSLVQKMELNKIAPFIQVFRKQIGVYRQELLDQATPQLSKECPKKIVSELIKKLDARITALFGEEAYPCGAEAISKAFRQVSMGKKPEQVLAEVTRSFVNKRLHEPIIHIRKTQHDLVIY